MADLEQREGQKTVVAFIAGLLIGGLLVWVFGSAPETDTTTPENTDGETSMNEDMTDDTSDMEDDSEASTSTNTTTPTRPTVPSTGEGSLEVVNQAAGNTVVLTSLELPTNSGWVVVREGTDGNVLGAARFDGDAGLIPDSVKLLRATVPGESYTVMFFTDNGDGEFDFRGDAEIEGTYEVFVAE